MLRGRNLTAYSCTSFNCSLSKRLESGGWLPINPDFLHLVNLIPVVSSKAHDFHPWSHR